MGLFVFDEHLTSECYLHFLENELPVLYVTPHFGRQVTTLLNKHFLNHQNGWNSPVLGY
jgi:hypothetical protein